MQIRNQRDFWAGVMFIVIGGAFAVLSLQYQVGTAAKMGPGYFPMVLGILMALLGVIVGLTGLSMKAPVVKLSPVGWRELFLVLLSVALFAGLLNTMGVIVALIVLVLVSSLASHEFNLKTTVLAAVVLCVMCWAVFVYGLELQFPVWPTFLTN